MAFEDLLVQLSSKLDESGFKALDRLENKAIKKAITTANIEVIRYFLKVLDIFYSSNSFLYFANSSSLHKTKCPG